MVGVRVRHISDADAMAGDDDIEGLVVRFVKSDGTDNCTVCGEGIPEGLLGAYSSGGFAGRARPKVYCRTCCHGGMFESGWWQLIRAWFA